MPCLLLQSGRLVKTRRFKAPVYIGDPINAIKIYNEKEVDELILLDISATIEGREPDYPFLESLAEECFMPVCYGGGVRTLTQLRRIFSLGFEKVALNSSAAENPSFVTEAANMYGSQSIVVSIDCKRRFLGGYQVLTKSGRQKVSNDPVRYAQAMENAGAGELLLYSVDRDGTWEGLDIELIRGVCDAVKIPVIACGGAGTLEHVQAAVKRAGASAVALGSMAVFQGKDLGVLIKFPSRHDLERILNYEERL